MSKVSVIMPAYNAANHISHAIESVLKQTYSDWELIVIDDGSTDNTADIVKQYTEQDSRIRYLWQLNGKQGKARNKGISISKGEIIAFLDADDLWLPEKLEKQIDKFHNLTADLIYSSSYTFVKDFDISNAGLISTEEICLSGETGFEILLNKNLVLILTVLCRKDAIYRAGNFSEDTAIAEDYHLWLKMLLTGSRFYGMNEITAAYHFNPQSFTGNDKEALFMLPEVFFNLKKNYPEQARRIQPYLKKVIKKNLYMLSINKKETQFKILQRFMVISNYQLFKPVFWIFEKLKLYNLSLRFAYFIFNYLP